MTTKTDLNASTARRETELNEDDFTMSDDEEGKHWKILISSQFH